MDEASARGRARRWGAGAVVVLALAVLAITVVVGMVRGGGTTTEIVAPAPAASGPATASTDGVAYVHVAGAVTAAGLYAMAPGARVADAVAAAGGFAPDADRAAVNLARTLQDGEQILVPVAGAAPPPGQPDADPLVNLNTADAAALDALPGIGPALAGRILTWREENGPFVSPDDLLAVPGIGEKLVAGLRDRVRV